MTLPLQNFSISTEDCGRLILSLLNDTMNRNYEHHRYPKTKFSKKMCCYITMILKQQTLISKTFLNGRYQGIYNNQEEKCFVYYFQLTFD